MGLTKKGMLCTTGAMAMLFAGTAGVSAYQEIKEEVLNEKEKQKKEEEFIAQEKEKKKALIAKYTGTKGEYVSYAYDAQSVSEMLMTKKYSSDEKMVFDNLTSSSVVNTVTQMFDEYNAKGTFFYTGSQVERATSTLGPTIQKLYENGNAIGNRSYSDSYRKLFPGGRINIDNFKEEYAKTDSVLQGILGENFKTRAYRCPGGSVSWRGVNDFSKEHSEKDSFGIIDWNVAPSSGGTGEAIAEKTIKASEGKDVVVILVPNLNEEKMLEFLKTSMKWYNSNGYSFKSLG